MPTGYTAQIADGITFKEYALGCARAFVALIEMRDDPSGAPIPEEFVASSYHADTVANAEASLRELELMDAETAQARADAAAKKDMAYHTKAIADSLVLRGKYEAMLESAQAYIAPSDDHREFKAFMVSQIKDSIKFDCGSDYHQRQIAQMNHQTGAEWIADQRANLQREVEYHSGGLAAERERAAERTAWVKQLKESLA